MNKLSLLKGAFAALFCAPLLYADPALVLTPVAPENANGIYSPGHKIVWRVEVKDDDTHAVTTGSYAVKQGGAKVIREGQLRFGGEPATIEASLDEPGTLLAEVTAPMEGKEPLKALAGAAVAPGKLQPSLPVPDDFDAFWKSKIDALSAIPAEPVLEKGDSGAEGVDYWKITMNNIGGTHIQGQLARPSTGKKLPAMLVVQWAGVYPLKKDFVLGPAREGWLVLNIIAHDLPIDQPKEYYDDLAKGALKDYIAIGNEDRETSYFLRMFLSCYRAAEYLAQRPDWDGKTLLVSGGSQGGLQSLVTAALHPKVTAVTANIPAGCDNNGALAERNPGWPYWKNRSKGHDEKKVMETSRYFDGVNFAARIHCPTLVGMGLIDVTSPASGVFSAVNQMKGPKEVVVMPNAPHMNTNNVQAPYYQRQRAWQAALIKGEPVPVQATVGLER